MLEPRRFPPPWSAEETDACFIVRDANGQALAYVYFEEEPGRRSAAHLMTRDEARAHRCQHRQAAGAAAAMILKVRLRSTDDGAYLVARQSALSKQCISDPGDVPLPPR
jgi:hypothetical protein